MGGTIGAILCFAFAGFLIWLLWKVLHMRNFIGDIFRLSWNLIISIWSIIPGWGFMRRLMVLDNDEDKSRLVEQGDEMDQQTQERWANEKHEKEALQAAKEQARREEEDDIRHQIYQKTGRTDVDINSDLSKWKYSDESWYDSGDIKKR